MLVMKEHDKGLRTFFQTFLEGHRRHLEAQRWRYSERRCSDSGEIEPRRRKEA